VEGKVMRMMVTNQRKDKDMDGGDDIAIGR